MLSYLLSDSFNNLHLKIYLMPRLIYNRIAKAGSSTMMTLIAALSHINNFTIYSYDPYWPTQDQLRKSLERLPPDSVYINHCNFVPDMGEDYHWINIVREPIEKDASLFYYQVSPTRGEKNMNHVLETRKANKQCGCAFMEYDACIRLRVENNCSLEFPDSAFDFFSSEKPQLDLITGMKTSNHTSDKTFQRVLHEYRFVGLTEELALSIKALEVLEPRFFRNASYVYADLKSSEVKNASPQTNKITHTSMTGAISSSVRSVLAHANPEDIKLYEQVKRLFWWTIANVLPEEINFGKTIIV